MDRLLLSAVALLLASGVLHADSPATSEQIQGWIADLDSPRFRTRDRATRELQKAGPDAAAALAKAARNGSAEAADRALRILGDMTEGADKKTEEAARRHLRRIAEGSSAAAGDALAILHRKRNRLLAQLRFAGATYREEGGQVTSITLDTAGDLELILPVLKEFPELDYLSISNKRFSDANAVHLKELPSLQYLNLFESNIGDEGLKHLTGLKNLRNLPMGHTRVTDKGLEIISGMTQLEYVGCRGNNVTDKGLEHLKNLTNLTGLNLNETKVTDAGLKKLAPLTKLKHLYLATTAVTDTGLEHLREFKDLRNLDLSLSKTTSTGRARLIEALPELLIDLSKDP
jgi:hypothetical protein